MGESLLSISHDVATVQKSNVKIKENFKKVEEKIYKLRVDMKKLGNGQGIEDMGEDDEMPPDSAQKSKGSR